jgi:hypothetical protein
VRWWIGVVLAAVALLVGGCGDDDPTERTEPEHRGCPDGAVRMAFSTPAGEEGGDLMALRADGEVVRLTDDGGSYGPAVSPDGAHVAFSSVGHDGSVSDMTGPDGLGIDVIDADGTGRRRLVDSAEDQAATAPAWSPDGRTIAFVHRPGHQAPTEIWSVPVDGSTDARRLVTSKPMLGDADPAWSPDGERIAIVRGGVTVMVAAADGSDAQPVHVQPDGLHSISWSPDGTRLAAAVGDTTETGGRVALVDLATGSVTTVSHHVRAPWWSASGRLYGFAVPPAVVDPTGSWRVAELEVDEGSGEARGRAVVEADGIGYLYGDAGVSTPACDAGDGALTSADDVPETLLVQHPVTAEGVTVLTRDQAEALIDTVLEPDLPDGTPIRSRLVHLDQPVAALEETPVGDLVWIVGTPSDPPDESSYAFEATSGRFLAGVPEPDRPPWSDRPDLAPPP